MSRITLKVEFSDKPSRLNCVFACPTYEQAIEYRKLTNKNTENIYEVEPIGTNVPIHLGDYGKVSPADKYLESIEECARNYWKGVEIILPEVVIGSPVKVIRKID